MSSRTEQFKNWSQARRRLGCRKTMSVLAVSKLMRPSNCWRGSPMIDRFVDMWGIPRHFDILFSKMYVRPHLSFLVQICLMRLSWDLISTVTSPQFHLRVSELCLGQCGEVSLQRCFRRQNWDIYSEKSPNQCYGSTHNEPESSILTFIS